MTVIIAFSVFLYGYVVFKGVKFFRQPGECRERDKSAVASLIALSVMVIVAEVVVWGAQPWELHGGPVGNSLLMAFNFANAFFYVGFIESHTENKVCRVSPLR